jgi:acetyl esterase
MITAEHDLLRSEGQRYARRLREVGALVEHHDIAGVDHGYDVKDADRAREGYELIADYLRRAFVPEPSDGG